MPYRNRGRVQRILAHQQADRVPYRAIAAPQIQALVDGMDLPPEHRAFCLEGDFAAVTIEPPAEVSRFKPYFGDLPNDVRFRLFYEMAKY